jgi:hypothetical protein
LATKQDPISKKERKKLSEPLWIRVTQYNCRKTIYSSYWPQFYRDSILLP